MSIVLEEIAKRFGNQWVVDNVSLEIADKELFVLLGSSGSGKSTILRIIAGLTPPTSGRVLLNGRDVTNLSPQERETGFVFQNYSIFRHMTVGENIEFGLRIRKCPKSERKRKREELLNLVDLAGLGSRYGNQLSGGQQQRVALARALAYEPKVLLLDEPFGALDVKIRSQLRRSLKEIQRRLGLTTILVTHDQEEAFELADRIGVLERGRLLEVGVAEALYAQPKSLFAASFLGAGTVLVGRAQGGQAHFGPISLPIPPDAPHEEGARVQLLFRPEQVTLSSDGPPPDVPVLGKGVLTEQIFTGPLRRVRLRLPRLSATRQLAPAPPFGEESLLIDAALPAGLPLGGRRLWVGLRSWTILKQPRPNLLTCDMCESSTAGLALTSAIAGELRASTTILGVAENPDGAEALRERLTERQLEAGLGDAQLHVRYGNALEQIAAEQAGTLYEMLIISARSPSILRAHPKPQRLSRLEKRAKTRVLGETVVSAIRYSYIPVLVVRGERARICRVLICTAAGEPGKADVVVGGRLARRLGALPTLLYVLSGASSEPDEITRDHLDRAAGTLRALDAAADIRVGRAPTPAIGILEAARSGDFDLIVIGCAGPRTRSFLEMNEVMLEVLAGADRPVLVVPTDRL